ncbi:hypothetical protein G7046_g4513 [Stylonectria norvegica]|nr:hypothetical protein G7046_g4513 [Stylonectria norvegica]
MEEAKVPWNDGQQANVAGVFEWAKLSWAVCVYGAPAVMAVLTPPVQDRIGTVRNCWKCALPRGHKRGRPTADGAGEAGGPLDGFKDDVPRIYEGPTTYGTGPVSWRRYWTATARPQDWPAGVSEMRASFQFCVITVVTDGWLEGYKAIATAEVAAMAAFFAHPATLENYILTDVALNLTPGGASLFLDSLPLATERSRNLQHLRPN